MIYADNAASTALHPRALEAMLPWLTQHWGNPGSIHTAGDTAARAVARARDQIAFRLGCSPREVYFTSSGSEADNQAVLTGAAWGAARGRRHVLAAAFEHPAVLRPLEHLACLGEIELTLLPQDGQGRISIDQAAAALREDTGLVSVMAANNEVGTLQPVEELAELCRARGALFHTDAVQAVGELPLERVKADLLSLSAHKFHGPKGVGALVCRNGLTPVPLIRGGGQERGCRAGTEHVSGIMGMAAALEEACTGAEARRAYVSSLRDRLAAGLARIPGAHLTAAGAARVSGIVHVCFEAADRETLLLLLDRMGVCASAGAACSAGALEPSHVLRSMGIPEALARGALRFSLCADNTPEEADAIADAAAAAVAQAGAGEGVLS